MNKCKINNLYNFLHGKEALESGLKSLDEKLEVLAYNFMNYLQLKCGENIYEIVESEIYYHSGENQEHQDIYVHRAIEQASCGRWYDHGSGLDITIGNRDTDARGGILIRSIYSVKDKNFINGPLNVKKELFFNMGDVFNPTLTPHFIEQLNTNTLNRKIYKGKRIGLNAEKDNEFKFSEKPYRYITSMENGNQFKEKENFYQELLKSQQMTKEEILKQLNYNPGFLK